MDVHISSSSVIPAVIITGLVITTFFLLGYYIFVTKFYLNSQSGSLVRLWFSLRRNEALISFCPEPEHWGLEEAMIWSIPVIRYKNCDESSSKCSVCLNEFQQNEKLRAIPNCNHTFHIDCIDIWLQKNDNCPLCRAMISLLPGGIDAAAGDIKAGPTTSTQDQISQVENENRVVSGYDEDFVVINLENEHDTRDRNSEAE
ncbi:hypothetical protein PIB30_079244 [Stylosanthes scabra]|uniref:RING-type E3 ubiquitin transferase n=1 Tax=Stylosanthes scabra TaxID=79078 RepID=A0ABU6ZPQ0_9FABA|nr:hypothetical protein [Stylosanthes scabra]